MPLQKSKKPNSAPPSGIKPSFQTGVPQSSIGVPTLDQLLGGGLSLGSIFLIEADDDSAYSQIIEKCFLSCADVFCHQLFYASSDNENVAHLYNRQDETALQTSQVSNAPQEKMKIAHMYENQNPEQMMNRHFSSKVASKNNLVNIDLSSERSLEEVDKRIHFEQSVADTGSQTLEKLAEFYELHKAAIPNPKMAHKKVCFRTLVSNLGAASWDGRDLTVLQFLAGLRKITPPNSFTVVTCAPEVVAEVGAKKLRRYFDGAVKITALSAGLGATDEEYVPTLAKKMGYHGLVSLTKCQMSQGLNPSLPDSNDLAFKFKKVGGLAVETLHLPPEGSVAMERINTNSSSAPNVKPDKIANLF